MGRAVTEIIALEDLPNGSSQISAVNLRTREILWTSSAQEVAPGTSPDRTKLQPEGVSLQRSLCAAIAGAAAVWVATKVGPNPVTIEWYHWA